MKQYLRWIAVLTTLAVVGVVRAQDSEATVEPGQDINPVFNQDFPDPDVLEVDGVYYAYATNSGETNIQAARSTDLVNWESVGEVLPEIAGWARQDFGWVWAPDVSQTDGGYLMYFVARFPNNADGTQCIGKAVSDNPEGPFEPTGDEPFICQIEQGGSIDPASFVDSDGQRYVLWKNDGNAIGDTTWVYIQAVSEDGLTLHDEPIQLMTADQLWEGMLIEAPTLWQQDGRYYLFYSANRYASLNYAIGYAVVDDIFGLYEKPTDEPFLETSFSEGIAGPGGQDIVLDTNGDTWMLYHTWQVDSYRAMNLVRLDWQDGIPTANPTRASMAAP